MKERCISFAELFPETVLFFRHTRNCVLAYLDLFDPTYSFLNRLNNIYTILAVLLIVAFAVLIVSVKVRIKVVKIRDVIEVRKVVKVIREVIKVGMLST